MTESLKERKTDNCMGDDEPSLDSCICVDDVISCSCVDGKMTKYEQIVTHVMQKKKPIWQTLNNHTEKIQCITDSANSLYKQEQRAASTCYPHVLLLYF